MDTKRLAILLGEGDRAFKANDFNKAEKVYGEIIVIDPQNREAFLALANIFHIKGQISKSIKAFKKVLEIDPGHTDAAISLSVLLNDIGQYSEASKIFENINETVKKTPDHGVNDQHVNKKFSSKHYELAELYLVYERYEEALYEYKKAIDLNPENLEIRVKVAKLYSRRGYINKAIDELTRLKAEHPDYTPGRVSLGLLHYGNGNTVGAQTEWMTVANKDPNNAEVRKYLRLSREATETRAF